MIATYCHNPKCRVWWTHNAGPAEHFQWITHYCPYCIAKMGEVVPWGDVR